MQGVLSAEKINIFGKAGNIYNAAADAVSAFCKKGIVSFIMVVLFKANLDFLFCTRIANMRASNYYNPNVINCIAGWIATILFAVVINQLYDQNRESSVIMTILSVIYFIPFLTFCSFGGGTSSFMLSGLIYWSFLLFLQLKIPIYEVETGIISSTKAEKIISLALVLLVSIVSFYFWIRYSHFHLQLNLYDVYTLRAQAAQYKVPMILTYLRKGCTIITAILIVRALTNRSYILVAYLLFIVLINFSYAADKSVAFFPLLLVGGFVFYRKKMISIIVPGFILIQIAAYLDDLFGSKWLMTFIVARQGTDLAKLSSFYYNFFNSHPSDLFRQGIMGKVGFRSIYGFLPNVIGNNYVNQSINCNNGMMADVWSSFGVIGILVMPIILIVCFRLMDCVSAGLDKRMTIGLIAYYAMYFANVQWSTVLLTQGYLITCIVLFFFPRVSNNALSGKKQIL